MRGPQTEIVDSLAAEHYEGSVSGIGAVMSITGNSIVRGGMVYNPTVGDYANDVTKYLKVSLDGGDGWVSVPYGGRFCFGVRPDDNELQIDAGVSGGVGYEVVLAVEKT